MSDNYSDDWPSQFFKQYQDRGMMKWRGFYLSDHTAKFKAAVNQVTEMENRQQPQQMALTEIFKLLEQAYVTQQQLRIWLNQLTVKDATIVRADVVAGIVNGFNEEGVYVSHQLVPYDTIAWIEIVARHRQ